MPMKISHLYLLSLSMIYSFQHKHPLPEDTNTFTCFSAYLFSYKIAITIHN